MSDAIVVSAPVVEDARHYLETHGVNILQAMELARAQAVVAAPDHDDRGYWEHEIRALKQAIHGAGLPPLPSQE